MIRLGVNIDHVATLRQARRGAEPDPVAAAAYAILGGADGITVHLREDRRHIQDRDLHLLKQTVVGARLNLELACEADVLAIACQLKPDEATLVPEKRQELTTEGGLDVLANEGAVAAAVSRPTLARLCASAAETTYSIEFSPAAIARRAPLGLATRAENSTSSKRFSSTASSSASASAGTLDGETNAVASTSRTPVATTASSSSILAASGMGSSICSPSRRHTSRMVTWVIYSTP